MVRQFVSLIVPNGYGKYATMFFKQKKEEPWRFAGGKVEPGELPIQAAARELKEELGVEADGLLLAHHQAPRYVDGDTWEGRYYLALSGDTPRIMETDKHGDLQYFNVEELMAHGAITAAAAVVAYQSTLRDKLKITKA